jgi:hypothetical protein
MAFSSSFFYFSRRVLDFPASRLLIFFQRPEFGASVGLGSLQKDFQSSSLDFTFSLPFQSQYQVQPHFFSAPPFASSALRARSEIMSKSGWLNCAASSSS